MPSQRKPEEPGQSSGRDATSSIPGSLQAAGAPLNDAASGLANLMSTAVPSLSKAFAAVSASLPSMVERKGPKEGEKQDAVVASQGLKDDEKHDAIMGTLQKWINIGRGWGPRLFVLEGVRRVLPPFFDAHQCCHARPSCQCHWPCTAIP